MVANDALATAEGDSELFVQSMRLLKDAARVGGGVETTTGYRSRYLLVKKGVHSSTWSPRVNMYVADTRHFTVQVNGRVTVHIYVVGGQLELTPDTKVVEVTM